MDLADLLVCRLMAVKEPAQVSVLSQLQQPRTEMLTLPGIPTTLTCPPPTPLKIPGNFSGILFFIFIEVWKTKCLMVVTSECI